MTIFQKIKDFFVKKKPQKKSFSKKKLPIKQPFKRPLPLFKIVEHNNGVIIIEYVLQCKNGHQFKVSSRAACVRCPECKLRMCGFYKMKHDYLKGLEKNEQ